MSGFRHTGLTEQQYWDRASLMEAIGVIHERYRDCPDAMYASGVLRDLCSRIDEEIKE